MNSSKEVGNTGESIACEYLLDKGYSIVERNYWRKWGELDIVARKGGILYFIEVKSVSREKVAIVSGEMGEYRAEMNMHKWKADRLKRVISTYLIENERDNVKWKFNLITVYLSLNDKIARVNMIKDIVL
jgi:putative endonuclease